jgi:uncharacterized protein (DUF2147 family)
VKYSWFAVAVQYEVLKHLIGAPDMVESDILIPTGYRSDQMHLAPALALASRGAVAAMLAIGIGLGAASARAASPEGLWRTELAAEIRITPCNRGFCGVVAKPVKPGLFDINNPDPALRRRPIEGLPLIWLSEGRSPQVWEAELYNPIDGKMYDGVVQIKGDGELHLRGCVFLIFCRSEDWVRLE